MDLPRPLLLPDRKPSDVSRRFWGDVALLLLVLLTALAALHYWVDFGASLPNR